MKSALRLDVNKKLQLQDIACEAYLILNNKITNQRRSVNPPFTIVVYNQSNCGTKVTSILTLVVSWNLQNKRLACQSFNRTYIEGFDITDTSELFNVSAPNKKKASELHFFVKAIIWITFALIMFVLAQHINNFINSRTEEEGDSDRRRKKTLERHRIRSLIKVRKTHDFLYHSFVFKGREGHNSDPNYVSITNRLACYVLTTTYHAQDSSGLKSFSRSLGLFLVDTWISPSKFKLTTAQGNAQARALTSLVKLKDRLHNIPTQRQLRTGVWSVAPRQSEPWSNWL
ncbi:hypothetical protein PoB_006694500 [Plakobranchus ocellatus]|uniref:Uncharacterized protein n=1 Tax=Plakobranchus ocellatus TaxID=259542 RepID=A0AAV4D901_9GAST|nr:hypothetical protein PoB_006694500 [Plakobranchus ocellatus]